MAKQKPKRINNHNSEELSERFFNNCLPENWYSYPPRNDYGVDLIVEIFEGEEATGLELIVQLKSTGTATENEIEKQTLDVSTYNYLNEKLRVAMIVKYVIPENEAYWILLKDIPSPNQKNKTFTINLPKLKKLSNINWEEIKEYVKSVTNRKLAAQKAFKQKESKKNRASTN